MKKRTYNLDDFWHTSRVQPNATRRQKIRLARAVRGITRRLIKINAPEEDLRDLADRLESISQELKKYGRTDDSKLFQRVYEGRASGEDLLDLLDYDFILGRSTPVGLPIDIWCDGDLIRGKTTVDIRFQGPVGRVHGGMLASIFDILLSRTQEMVHAIGYTASLKIDYISATPINKELNLEAKIVKIEGKKLYNSGKIIVDGQVTAKAKGLWVLPAAIEQTIVV